MIQVQRYRQRVSGPLLDRIDLHLEVPAVSYSEMSRAEPGESSASIRRRVLRARALQSARLGGGARCNGRMRPGEIRQHCALDSGGAALLQAAVHSLNLSARAYDRILKVARTIADLEEASRIEAPHLQEAVSYRSLDREVWK